MKAWNMADPASRRVAVLATDGVERVERTEPVKVQEQAKAEVAVVTPRAGQIQGMNRHEKGGKLTSITIVPAYYRIALMRCCCLAASPIRVRSALIRVLCPCEAFRRCEIADHGDLPRGMDTNRGRPVEMARPQGCGRW
jgi:hypothetical protein